MKKVTSISDKDIQHNSNIYDEYINHYKMKNGWHPGNQQYNFKTLLRLPQMAGVSLKNASVLDVGCGTGDLLKILKKEGISDYLGVDIYKPSLQKAQQIYPDDQFILGDILTMDFKEKFYFAFCSGALTVKLSFDNYVFLQSMVAKMWSVTNVGLAFNVLTDDDRDPDPELFFYNPEKVLAICQKIAPDAIIGAERTPHVSQIHVFMYRESD